MSNQINRELTDDEMTELYSELCDVVERTYHGRPLLDPEDEVGIRHVQGGPGAASRIIDIIDDYIGTDLEGGDGPVA